MQHQWDSLAIKEYQGTDTGERPWKCEVCRVHLVVATPNRDKAKLTWFGSRYSFRRRRLPAFLLVIDSSSMQRRISEFKMLLFDNCNAMLAGFPASTPVSLQRVREYYKHSSTIVLVNTWKLDHFRAHPNRNPNPKSEGNSFRPKGQIIPFGRIYFWNRKCHCVLEGCSVPLPVWNAC